MNSAQTRANLLTAAENCLRENGYAAFSTRQVALIANVPLSQIHYHFGSKQGLLLALFETLNERLLQRQTEMFEDDLPLWRQWEIACDFLDDDLSSGYVRIMNELAVVGWSDPQVAEAVRQAMSGWKSLLVRVARKASKRFDGLGPFQPGDVAALVSSLFLGAEINILSGHEQKDFPVRCAVRRFGRLIRKFEGPAANGG
ncbi:MAG: TetR/AcrR family transcriptional regulator [Betaproteobacteria bacterium]|nr:MAG: TetR/AcrR family transcriptional regulator [Betaproteobacteria bacterium]